MTKISLAWFREIFKSEKEKELDSLKVDSQKIKNELLVQKLEAGQKPYLNVKIVNNVLTVVLRDGNIISKANATKEDFNRARLALSEDDLFKIVENEDGLEQLRVQEKQNNRLKFLKKGIEQLVSTGDFETRENAVYMKGVDGNVINRSVPELLVEKFVDVLEKNKSNYLHKYAFGEDSEEYQALKKFWLKCCLNPNAQSAEDLYAFLSKHQIKIDRHGNFYAYRRVVSTAKTNKQLVEFVSNAYNKIKAVWKKKPSDYWINDNEGELSFSKQEFTAFHDLGNLESLYLDLPNMQKNSYTSAHTGSEDYRIGEVIAMPRNDGDDDNTVNCSKGFHAASKEYDYSSFGDTPILVIINPMDVLAVPHGEIGKLRTCRWFFAMTLPQEEQYILDNDDFDVMDLGDVFEEKCLENMQDYVKNSFVEEVKRHTFNLSHISSIDVTNIIESLEEMKEIISNRIKEVN